MLLLNDDDEREYDLNTVSNSSLHDADYDNYIEKLKANKQHIMTKKVVNSLTCEVGM